VAGRPRDSCDKDQRQYTERFLRTNGLQITGYRSLSYRHPDLEDPTYWEAQQQVFKAVYRHVTRLQDAKYWVYLTAKALERLGPDGSRVSAELGVGFVDRRQMRCRGQPPAEDDEPVYREAKLRELRARYTVLRKATSPPSQQPSAAVLGALIPELEGLPVRNETDIQDYDGVGDQDRLRRLRSRAAAEVLERKQRGLATLMEAKAMVFDAMWALELEPEGRRVLERDDLYIAGGRDVRRKNHHPVPEDPSYWIARLQYFDECYNDVTRWDGKLISLQTTVHNIIWELGGLGRAGQLLLLDEELNIAYPSYEVRYRGDDDYDSRYSRMTPPDFGDPGYWEGKRQGLEAKLALAKSGLPGRNVSLEEAEELEIMEEQPKPTWPATGRTLPRRASRTGLPPFSIYSRLRLPRQRSRSSQRGKPPRNTASEERTRQPQATRRSQRLAKSASMLQCPAGDHVGKTRGGRVAKKPQGVSKPRQENRLSGRQRTKGRRGGLVEGRSPRAMPLAHGRRGGAAASGCRKAKPTTRADMSPGGPGSLDGARVARSAGVLADTGPIEIVFYSPKVNGPSWLLQVRDLARFGHREQDRAPDITLLLHVNVDAIESHTSSNDIYVCHVLLF